MYFRDTEHPGLKLDIRDDTQVNLCSLEPKIRLLCVEIEILSAFFLLLARFHGYAIEDQQKTACKARQSCLTLNGGYRTIRDRL